MLVMWTLEGQTNALGEFMSGEQAVGFHYPALSVNPFGLYGVQPWALLGQKAADDPHPTTTLFNPSVVLPEPASDLLALVPAGVVPDKEQNLLVRGFEPLAAPQKKLGRYAAYGATFHKAQPRLFKLRQKQPVARDGLGLGIILGDRLFYQPQGLSGFGPAIEGGLRHPAPPGLIFKSCGPLGIALCQGASVGHGAFFLSYRRSGLVIHRLARS